MIRLAVILSHISFSHQIQTTVEDLGRKAVFEYLAG